ncbi:MAG TPA: hydantoinase B/oxoprolinase family protein [Candidatus Binataceae bacterium]|nr:hydantoinase B/oxoprolinase family protein [Candidatus Binataceae bacterium]
MKIDPITAEVILNRLTEVAATMEHALYHSGYSPILRESQDGTAGLLDAEGRIVMISGGLQYHSLVYGRAVESVIERFGDAGLRPGDTFIVNDPYQGGNSHVPDIVAITPVFHRGRRIAFTVSVAHKADLGGIVPGSSGAAAREIFHDGLLLPPVRYMTADGVSESVEDIIRSNSRIPEIVIGDLRGQAGCTRLGAARLDALADEYGAEMIRDAMDGLLRTTAARARATIARWNDGEASAEGYLDHDGADLQVPIRIQVSVIKRGERLMIDFSGCGPQTAGPINLNAVTTRAISLVAFVAAADPELPVNAGLLEALEFIIPEGTVVSPRRPATVNNYVPTMHVVYNCLLAALGHFNPGRAVAPSGLGGGAIAIGYPQARGGRPDVQYELMSTALGATPVNDGASIVMAMNHFTPSTPIEVLESEYPVMVRCFDIRRDSGGPGRYRGGIGFVREYQVKTDCTLTVRHSNHRFGASGIAGGKGPPTSRVILNPDGPAEYLDTIVTRMLAGGAIFRLEQSGGAGYGPPATRPPAMVATDVSNGYVSPESAARDYGVMVDPETHAVDESATIATRAQHSR